MAQQRDAPRENRSAIGDGGKGAGFNPLATASMFRLRIGQSTVMRVAAVVPLTSAIGVPMPTEA